MQDSEMVALRPMTALDVEAVAELETECFSDAWSERLLREMTESPYDEAWVLEASDGALIGYANFRFLCGEGELMRIAVQKEARGRGYARKLMDRLEKSSREKNAPDLTLEVREGNQPAVSLYKHYGFHTEAVRRGYYHNPDEDALIMWRRGMPGIPT